MITLRSDLRVSFEELGISFQRMLDEKNAQLRRIMKTAVDNFDFEKALTLHIHGLIEEGIEKAASEIDLSGRIKHEIWSVIEARLGVK